MFFFKNQAIADYEKVFFDFKIESIAGEKIDFQDYKNKLVLLVNTASYCGFTKQYDDLQKLYEDFQDRGLVVIGVPANQFGSQEPGTENEIKNFCETNFNITFPMTSKYEVKGDKAHPIYIWAKDTFGKSTVPKWNFHKILINKNGKVVDTFASFTKPISKKVINRIEEIL